MHRNQAIEDVDFLIGNVYRNLIQIKTGFSSVQQN